MLLTRALLILAGLLFALPSFADTPQCIEDHKHAQEQRQAGRLVIARDTFRRCAAQSCPAVIRDECKQLHTQTQSLIPTVVFEANGAPATVSIDGGPEDPLTPVARELDPGRHGIRFTHEDGRIVERTFELAAGDKNKTVVVDFGNIAPPVPTPPPAAAPPYVAPADAPSYVGPIVMASVAGGAALLFGAFALAGKAKENELDGCKPRCDEDDVTQMRQRYLAADIMIGVAGVSAATALIWWLAIGGQTSPAAAGAVRPSPLGVHVTF